VTKQFHGRIPLSRDLLVALPGVGEYAADATLSLVVGEKVPMVDRNAVRVISRIFSIRLPSNYRKAVKTIRDFLMPIVCKYGGTEFNFGLLDFAAAVCTARDPKCPMCVIRCFCDYAQDRAKRGLLIPCDQKNVPSGLKKNPTNSPNNRSAKFPPIGR
jgi:A/G-specific adenine glycosylase